MKYIKSFISLFLLACLVSVILNFIDHGSIFYRKPYSVENITASSCESHIKNSFIGIAKKRNDPIDYDALNKTAKDVCDCARSKNLPIKQAVSECIYNLH